MYVAVRVVLVFCNLPMVFDILFATRFSCVLQFICLFSVIRKKNINTVLMLLVVTLGFCTFYAVGEKSSFFSTFSHNFNQICIFSNSELMVASSPTLLMLNNLESVVSSA